MHANRGIHDPRLQVKATHPNTPLTLYANGSGGLLERMAGTGADVIGLDWTVDMADARARLGPNQAVQVTGPAALHRQRRCAVTAGLVQAQAFACVDSALVDALRSWELRLCMFFCVWCALQTGHEGL